MQGKQYMSNTERKGPHKSMHCKFCKPPGVTTPEKPSQAQLETKTKIHLAHEAADLRVCNIHNEPGFPAVESEACICVLEGENSCPKCVPDKNRPPPKKKVCTCPKGAKPHPSMFNQAAPKKKKPVERDDEFWWEKYSREHDALAKETWAAYMAQRRKDKKLEKCKKHEREKVAKSRTKVGPDWYQKLSCQQMIYVEYLSTAIRLDSDENITDRTHFVLGGIGLYPRPKKKVLKRCLRYCHYNSIRFLNQLRILIKDEDPFQEKLFTESFTWNERLIMNSMCYLEFPALLRELMDRLPPLPRPQLRPQIPYPVFPVLPKKKYSSPYEEPIWRDRLNWVEKLKIDRLNRCRLYMETKRVKIPPLALVKRPSLIDARPPFLAQIEANERARRRVVKEKEKRAQRKHAIPTFNSAVDVTAIAGIEASDISTTEKADTEDICVFLREPKVTVSVEEEGEGVDLPADKEVRFTDEPPQLETQLDKMQAFSDLEGFSEEGEIEEDDMPFKTPPKTESGETLASPCPPPDSTPGPPATHYDKGRWELDIVNQEICGFFPFVTSSAQTVKAGVAAADDVELNLKWAAEKLRKIAGEEEEEKPHWEGKKKSTNTEKLKGKGHKKKPKKTKKLRGTTACEAPVSERVEIAEIEEREEEKALPDEKEREEEEEEEEEEDLEGMQISFRVDRVTGKKISQKESEISDPDPDSEDEWSARPPCVSEKSENSEKDDALQPAKRRKGKASKRKAKKKKKKKKKRSKDRKSSLQLKEEKGEYRKKREVTSAKLQKRAMMENEGDSAAKGKEPEKEERKAEVFAGNVEPLVEDIIKDLADEGFYSASYPLVSKHPDINQLILHLQGDILTKQLREDLRAMTKVRWSRLKSFKKFVIPELGISAKTAERADWNDKKWISRLANRKKDQFYYRMAKARAEYSTEFYDTLYQTYFGSERYLKIFYAYMPSKYEDCILRGIF